MKVQLLCKEEDFKIIFIVTLFFTLVPQGLDSIDHKTFIYTILIAWVFKAIFKIISLICGTKFIGGGKPSSFNKMHTSFITYKCTNVRWYQVLLAGS